MISFFDKKECVMNMKHIFFKAKIVLTPDIWTEV